MDKVKHETELFEGFSKNMEHVINQNADNSNELIHLVHNRVIHRHFLQDMQNYDPSRGIKRYQGVTTAQLQEPINKLENIIRTNESKRQDLEHKIEQSERANRSRVRTYISQIDHYKKRFEQFIEQYDRLQDFRDVKVNYKEAAEKIKNLENIKSTTGKKGKIKKLLRIGSRAERQQARELKAARKIVNDPTLKRINDTLSEKDLADAEKYQGKLNDAQIKLKHYIEEREQIEIKLLNIRGCINDWETHALSFTERYRQVLNNNPKEKYDLALHHLEAIKNQERTQKKKKIDYAKN